MLIFQEQVILLSQHLAGFSLPKADILRHAMAKKKLAMMRSLKIDFIRGCLQNKIATPEAERF